MSLVLVALIAVVGTLVGLRVGLNLGRREVAASKPARVEAICGCEHELAMHDPQTNRCHDLDQRIGKFNNVGRQIGWTEVPCRCRQYVGPRPIDDLFQPGFIAATEADR